MKADESVRMIVLAFAGLFRRMSQKIPAFCLTKIGVPQIRFQRGNELENEEKLFVGHS